MQTYLSIWATIGPLIGVLLGSWLASKNQRKQWTLHNRRDEYRELLTTIADAGSTLMVHYGMNPIVVTAQQEWTILETARKSVDLIYNRLFIAKEIGDLNILRRWQDAISELQKTQDMAAFGKSMDGIVGDVRKAAIKDFS